MSVLLSEMTVDFIKSAGEPHPHWNPHAFVYFDPDTHHCFLYDPGRASILEFYYDNMYHGRTSNGSGGWTEADPAHPHHTEYELMQLEIAHQMGEGHSNKIRPEY